MNTKSIVLYLIFGFVNAKQPNINHEELLQEINDIEDNDEVYKTIFPGTKWCGPGNISPDGNSLGLAAKTDACCREHDRCPDVIKAGQSRYGLTNTVFYTRLNCKCDQTFYNCLKTNGDAVSNKVGKIYFNVISTQCFKEDYPIVMCRKFANIFGTKCAEYELNPALPKKYQWFDVPSY